MKSAVQIGSRVEMFTDEWLIEEKSDVELTLHRPIRKEVVLASDRPWEQNERGFCSVIQETDGIRFYYRGRYDHSGSSEAVTCYAESADGIHVTKPEFDLYPLEAGAKSNIVWKQKEGFISNTFAAFLDRSPNVRPHERYKAVGGAGSVHGGKGLFALCSGDGVKWNLMTEEPVLTDGYFDSHNVVFWDSNCSAYRCYSRYADKGIRAIQSSISTDFIHWSPPQPNQYAEGIPMEHFYTNATIQCPGAEHMYLSFPMRFMPKRKKVEEHRNPGVSDSVFMTSRDGVHWDRTFREAWLLPGPDERNWTDRNGIIAFGCVETEKELSFYADEHYRWPDNRLRRLAVRKHGFASVRAGYGGGQFITRPLVVAGSHLVLNYSTSAVGFIQVEVQDEAGHPLEGLQLDDAEPLYGDEVEGTFRWKSPVRLDAFHDRPIRFRFVMQDADLYSMRVKT